MKIGAVMPVELSKFFIPVLDSHFPSVDFQPFMYESFLDIPGILTGHQHEVDAILFMGQSAMQYASHYVTSTVPWSATAKTPASFLSILVEVMRRRLPLKLVTDVEDRPLFTEAFHDAGLTDVEILIRPVKRIEPNYDEKDAAMLSAAIESGAASFAVTKFAGVAEMLKKKNVPAFLLLPATENIISAMKELIISCRVQGNRENLMSAIRIHLEQPDLSSSLNVYALNALYQEASANIYKLASKIHAATVRISDTDFFLICQRQLLARETSQFRNFPLLYNIKNNAGVSLSIGIGLGKDPEECCLFADTALNHAIRTGVGRLFIYDENGHLIGPFTDSTEMEMSRPNDRLRQIAQKSGISLRYLSLIYVTAREQGKNQFVPSELADVLGISLRTMNRIILKLIDCGVCKEVGKHFSHKNGRPSRIVEIDLENE